MISIESGTAFGPIHFERDPDSRILGLVQDSGDEREDDALVIREECIPRLVRELNAIAPQPVTGWDDFQREVGAWQDGTFPDATRQSVIAHFGEEAEELRFAVALGNEKIAEEAADCFLLLIGLANKCGFSLIDAARAKFGRNQDRKWGTVTAEGYTKHTAEEPSIPDVRHCRVCGCTDRNCLGCIERTGERCYWVDEDLCSACVGAEGGESHVK